MYVSVISEKFPDNLEPLVTEVLNKCLSPVGDTVLPDKNTHICTIYKITCCLQIFLSFSGTCPWAKLFAHHLYSDIVN